MSTTTPTPHPHNHQYPPQTNDNRHYGLEKAVDISDCIAMIETAVQYLQVTRADKNKAKKHNKPRLMYKADRALIQALMVSKAHLDDYRKQVIREVRTKHEIVQESSITTEKFMVGLSPLHNLAGKTLREPWESIEKLKALLSLLMASQDEETGDFRIDNNKVACSLNLFADVIEEVETRAWDFQSHCRDLWGEFQERLGKYYLVRRDLAKRVVKEEPKEVLA